MNLLSSLLTYTARQIARLLSADTVTNERIDATNQAASVLSGRVSTNESNIQVMGNRLDTAISGVTTDTEVTDIRAGNDGVSYSTAGTAVRTQFSHLKSDMSVIPFAFNHYEFVYSKLFRNKSRDATAWFVAFMPARQFPNGLYCLLTSVEGRDASAPSYAELRVRYTDSTNYTTTITTLGEVVEIVVDKTKTVKALDFIGVKSASALSESVETTWNAYFFSDYVDHVETTKTKVNTLDESVYFENQYLTPASLDGATEGSFFVSRYYPCKEGDQIISSGAFSAANGERVLEVYDEDLALIGYINGTGSGTRLTIDYTFPSNARYFRIRCMTAEHSLYPNRTFKYIINDNSYAAIVGNQNDVIKSLKEGECEVIPVNRLNFSMASFDPSRPENWWASTIVSGIVDCSDYCRLEIYSKNAQTSWLVCWMADGTAGSAHSANKKVRTSYSVNSDVMYVQIASPSGGSISMADASDDIVILGYFKKARNDSEISLHNAMLLTTENVIRKGLTTDSGVNSTQYYYSYGTDGPVYLTGFMPCVSGDVLEIAGGLATSWYAYVTYDADGHIVSAVKGLGQNSYETISHEFTDDEAYFVAGITITGQIRYISSYKNVTDVLPVNYNSELESVDSRLKTAVNAVDQSIPLVYGFSTDQHYNPRRFNQLPVKYGAMALAELSRRNPIDAIVLGGDITSYSDSFTVANILEDVTEYLSYYSGAGCPVISVAGNHDSEQNNEDITPYQMYNVHFKRAVQSKAITKAHPMGTNGYIDYEAQKIRFIIVDTNPRLDMTSALCADWLADAFNTLPSGWTTIVCGHQPILPSLPTPPFYNPVYAYEDVILENKSKIEYIVVGHSHRDGVYVSSEGITVINTTCGLNERRYDSASNSPKATAFDIFVFDKLNKIVKSVRFGNGYDRTITLTGTIVTVTYNLANAATLNNSVMRMRAGSSFDDLLTGVTGTVTVTMDGTDITASAYSNGKITIPALTGNVVITEA